MNYQVQIQGRGEFFELIALEPLVEKLETLKHNSLIQEVCSKDEKSHQFIEN